MSLSRPAAPATAARGVPLSSSSRSGSSEGPGWWARICYCLALAIGCVPIGLVTPNDHEYLPHPGILLTLVCIALGLLQVILGATGLLLIRGASWARRGLSVGIFAVITVCCVAAPYIAGGLLANAPDLALPPLGVTLFLLAVFGGAIGSVLGQLACWSMLQHRPGWTYAVAGFYSFGAGVVIAVVTMMTWFPYISWVTDAISVGAHILLLIGGLGLLHVVQWAIDRRTRLSSVGSPGQGRSAQTWPSDYPGHPGRSIR